MSKNNYEAQLTSLLEVMKRSQASTIAELGTLDDLFVTELFRKIDWVPSVEIHCSTERGEEFDASLESAAQGSPVSFNVIKHIGSETEVCDAIMRAAEEKPFDVVFISNASDAEALLTACMVSNESVKSGGIIGISSKVVADNSMGVALASFKDLFGDSYEDVGNYLFIKNP